MGVLICFFIVANGDLLVVTEKWLGYMEDYSKGIKCNGNTATSGDLHESLTMVGLFYGAAAYIRPRSKK